VIGPQEEEGTSKARSRGRRAREFERRFAGRQFYNRGLVEAKHTAARWTSVIEGQLLAMLIDHFKVSVSGVPNKDDYNYIPRILYRTLLHQSVVAYFPTSLSLLF